jgi:membrane protein DedA with SNARE-associated domain
MPALALTIPMWLQDAINNYGYWMVFAAVAIESLGIPFPGETALLAGAIYAATTHHLSIAFVIAAASAGAIMGDNIGYLIGHFGGHALMLRLTRTRLAHALHFDEAKIAYAQRYFAKYGDKTVFIGRFFSLLRTWVAFLAGTNRMRWSRFLFWNATGGIAWATIFGILGFTLGHNIPLLTRVLGILGAFGVALGVLCVVGIVVWVIVHKRREKRALASVGLDSASAVESVPVAQEEAIVTEN